MRLPLSVAAFVLIGAAAPAFADSVAINSVPLSGSFGGPGGYHVITIDGATCKVLNSTASSYGTCNYTISFSGAGANGKGGTWAVVPAQASGCSTKCE